MKLFHFISNFEQSILKFWWNFNSLTRKWSIIFTKGILPFWLLGGFYSCTFIICYWSHNLLNAKLHIWSKWEWAKQLSTFLSVIKVEFYVSSFRYEWYVLKLCKVKCCMWKQSSFGSSWRFFETTFFPFFGYCSTTKNLNSEGPKIGTCAL